MYFKINHILTILFLLLFADASSGQILKTQQQALKQVFPGNIKVARKVIFLTDTQVEKIQKLAKAKVESKIVTYYVGSEKDSIVGFVFFETSIVRTKPASIMIVVNPDSTVKDVDILAFHEPFDYLPIPNWLKLFKNKILNNRLWPRREIHGISGATLTVRAITLNVRKALAIFQTAIAKEYSE